MLRVIASIIRIFRKIYKIIFGLFAVTIYLAIGCSKFLMTMHDAWEMSVTLPIAGHTIAGRNISKVQTVEKTAEMW